MSGTYQICSKGILGKFAKQLDIQMDDGEHRTRARCARGRRPALGSTAIATASIDDADSYTVCMTF